MLNAASSADLADEIRNDVEQNRIHLPTLPEVALQVRDAVENDSADVASIARMVGEDAALSARLLQVANSPLYRGRNPINNIKMAITRMGLKLVRSLVVSLAMRQMFQAKSEALDSHFHKIWEDSLQVAAISRVLAGSIRALETEQAMLAGLIHNIGVLPILTKLDDVLGFDADEQTVESLIQQLAPELGSKILRHWRFAESMVDIPLQCLDLERNPSEQPDYCDLVLVARQQHLASSGHPEVLALWGNIPAFDKLGLEAESIVVEMEGPAEEIAAVRDMLSS